MLKKYVSVVGGFAALFAVAATAADQRPLRQAQDRPNLLVLFTDDQRMDTLGCYNAACPIDTPNLDRLAERGIQFTNGFVTTPICAVSRACVQTGRYESNHRMHQFETPFSERVFEHTYPVYLREAGYFTGHFGKYGVGITKEQRKQFDRFDGQSGQGPKFRKVQGKDVHDSEWLTLKTEEFLDAVPKGKPFVLQLSYKAPHASSCPAPEDDHLLDEVSFERSPYDTKEAFDNLPDIAKFSLMERVYAREFNNFDERNINHYMRQYHEKIVSVERSVGKVLQLLEERDLADNTVIIFLSDHGTHFGEKQLAGKWTPYEESLRIPFIIYDPRPGARKGVVSDKMVLNIDVAPTLLDLAGVDIPEIMDGKSLVPLTTSASSLVPSAWRTEFFFEHFTSPSPAMRPIPRTDGIRTEDFKYVRWFDEEPAVEELFDLRNDPAEMKNLAANPEHAETLKKMRAKYEAWRTANPSTYSYDSYGHRAQWGAKEIDWEHLKEVRPEIYEKIAKQVERLGVTWEQAVNDWKIRKTICNHAGYWY
jgi:arylsulfatase A-like enzyme